MPQHGQDGLIFIVPFVPLFMLLVAVRKLRARSAWREAVREERDGLLDMPVPGDIAQSIIEYRSGAFSGEEQSPLSYVGYRVGIARGLEPAARHRRLSFGWMIDMPSDLPAKYQRWGGTATLVRFQSSQRHLHMLADQRRSRTKFAQAVSAGDSDRRWFQIEAGETAARFSKAGFRQ